MIDESDRLAEYQYKITEFYILENGREDSIPVERIRDFKIENYFDDASFPIFKLNVVLEPSRYYSLIKNKQDVRFKLRIQMFYTVNGNSNRSLYRDIINDTFCMFPDDDNSDYTRELKDEAKTRDDINKLTSLDTSIELFLFKEMVSDMRSSINTVLRNCDVCTAVTYLLQKGNVKHVLMSPFENTTVYNEILLPPQSIDKQIRFLNNTYGFHRNGTMVYYGLLHSYIIDYKGGCTAWYNKEWKETVLYVLERSNRKSQLNGAILRNDQERHYYNINPDNIDIVNNAVSENVINGIDVTVVDLKNALTTSESIDVNVVGRRNSNIVYNTTSNRFMAEAYIARQKANGTIVTLAIEHVNMEAFTPNKTFSLVFESPVLNSKYKGNYKISSSIYTFSRDGDCFTISAVITLKKVD